MTNLKSTTPLHSALIDGHPTIARKHIERKEFINDQNENGDTPLLLAVEFENVFKLLLSAGADANISNNSGKTP